jgi:hypothetical protein
MKGRLRLSYVLILCLVFTLAVAVPSMARAEPIEEWVARYNGPGNFVDAAKAIAIDASGNVYVTGVSWDIGTGGDYATVKYDTNGNQLWVARYNGPENGDDETNAIAVDASGNVYVTGRSPGSGTDVDYATVKYDTDGAELWVARYNGPENDWDSANAIAVDAFGNVYVTGWSGGGETVDAYATVKYDPDGNELWGQRLNQWALGQWGGIIESSAGGVDLAVDSSGNVYVTGSLYDWIGEIGGDRSWDYGTVKYDTNGNELWVKRYNGPENGDDRAGAIAVDASGNVYVTGGSPGSDTDSDYTTVKYDTDGNELWVKQYNGPGDDMDHANAIAVDASGNVYVTGSSLSGTDWITSDYATVKYDTDGTELWVKRYNGPTNGFDHVASMSVDTLGNVYVTGRSPGSGTDVDYATVKYGEMGEVEVTMDLPGGWSMISLPVRPDVATVATLFPEAVVVYKYKKGVGYVRVTGGENLEIGVGYWVLLNNPQSYVIMGMPITEYTMPVADGWYMIGGCTDPAQTMVTTGSVDVIYEYTQESEYTRVPGSGPLERGKGYWILFSNTSEGAEFMASTAASE